MHPYFAGLTLHLDPFGGLNQVSGLIQRGCGTAPGGLDVSVRELGVDCYATSCHKWMLAPKGNGLL
jgi:hypothetical protein